MQKKLLYLLLFFFPIFLTAQNDTIVVQTLTWDANTRSGDFLFPDANEGPFEKVLMMYNMRCNNAAVGNGDVGCREWDYSCNTFVTTPELIDSTVRTHPSHLVSNFDGSSFEYSDNPVYSYIQFEQFETTYSNTISESTTQVGDGEALANLTQSAASAKTQVLFTADELMNAGLNAGDISGLRLDISNANAPLNFLRLRLKHSSQSELDANNPELADFTEVYFQNTNLNDAWHNFNFYSPFEWDGSSNVLLEMTYFHSVGVGDISATATGTAFTSVLNSSESQQSLRFNGAGQLNIPTEPLQSISSEITVSMWVNGNAEVMPTNSTIFEASDEDNNRQVNVHLPWSNGRIYWDCGNDGTGYDRIEKDALTADYEGQWNHWAFTKNTNTGEMKMFLNGVLWHSGTGKTKDINIAEFAVGSSVTWVNKYFGKVNEVRIFDKALEESTIAEWMRKTIDVSHPNYANLVAYYPLNEGSGNQAQDFSTFAQTANIAGSPDWQEIRATDFYKDFSASSTRPNVIFVQGEYEEETETLIVLDSIVNSQNEVITFEVDNLNNLIGVDTTFYWEGGLSYLYDENGNIIDIYDAPIDGSISISELTYYDKRDAKLELLSMVTPYGNGLDLGDDGKTFTFDVTDFLPVLHGERFLSVEFGAWQEDLDIKFLFIKGTPPRDVISIQNVWPFSRGWYQNIQEDGVFEPRMMTFDNDGEAFKLRSSVTGHGQNGEFITRNHFLNVGGGSQEFVYQVWKTCGSNPIYPQGGTWIFDRAGWCPGMATDVHEFDISNYATPGGSIEMDYGVNGAFMSEANYLVSNQMVTYGAPNFTVDAAIESIIRPSLRVEYERLNPACNLPQIIIKNTGAQTLTSLQIQYGTQGGMTNTYSWSGNLGFMETATVTLPVDDFHFWLTDQEDKIFEVIISQPNGLSDEYANNNVMKSAFEEARVFDDPAILLQTRTNNRASKIAIP